MDNYIDGIVNGIGRCIDNGIDRCAENGNDNDDDNDDGIDVDIARPDMAIPTCSGHV